VQEVLDGLHVVVRGGSLGGTLGLDPLDAGGVVGVERLVGRPEGGAVVGGNRQRRGLQVGECEEVLHLDADAGTHQAGLAGVRTERGRPAGVAPVERRDGVEFAGHGSTLWVSGRGKSVVGV
jgi:hypothetical protein